MSGMQVWIDLSNSPHPLLFAPIARRLETQGHAVLLTARDNAQTVQLARERWPEVEVIGGASPEGRRAKAQAMSRRVAELRRWARSTRPHVAMSHNSYGQILAAWSLRIPTVTAMDFEHQPANHLAFRLARMVLLPAALQNSLVHRQGAVPRKTRFYPGLKEELYLADFEPDAGVFEKLGVKRDRDSTVVLARPAPDLALYHDFENPLFIDCVKEVLSEPKTTVLALPRHDAQRRALRDLGLSRCIVPERAVDSRSLMSQADLMIGAGGTMTREAALMGTPTVSLFAGQQPAVDRWLEEQGFMTVARSVSDLPVVQRQPGTDRLTHLRARGEELVEHFCAALHDAVRSADRR